jgi:hypothetical protein
MVIGRNQGPGIPRGVFSKIVGKVPTILIKEPAEVRRMPTLHGVRYFVGSMFSMA